MKKLVIVLSLLFVAIASSATNAPSVYFGGILKGIKVDPGNGYLIISNIWARYLPEEVATGKIVISKDGVGIYEYKWKTGTTEPPDTEMLVGEAVDMKTGQHEGMPRITEAGNYMAEFFAGDEKFYKFPFKISTLPNPAGGDPFVFMEGAWSDWGYLYYPDGDPNRELEWAIWLRNYSPENKKVVKISAEIVSDKGGKLICKASMAPTWTLMREWQKFNLKMTNPPGHPSGEEYTKAKYLLENDGPYTLTMKIEGKLYGVWKFNVKGKKLEPVGRTVRGKTDPLTFIDGGDSGFWYEKQK